MTVFHMRKRLFGPALIFLTLGVLSGCSEANRQPLLHTVQATTSAAFVPAHGELEARSAASIQAPQGRRPKFIAWMQPEYTRVSKGDVILRFDGASMERERSRSAGDLNVAREDLREKRGALDSEEMEIFLDISQVGTEKEFAEKFAVQDDLLKSRLEILDDALDAQYLDSKLGYLGWKNERFTTRAGGELDVLSVQESKHSKKIERLDQDLAKLEVVAPHDGLLVYEANWRGEKPRVGSQIWPGRKVGDLPDVSVMQARLYVLDREATGLAEGQFVEVWVETMPERRLPAKVTSVSPAPRSIERGNPQKYYELVAEFDQQYPDIFKLGRGLRAEVRIREEALRVIIPLQSVFHRPEGAYVFVWQGDTFVEREVSLGDATPTHIEVVDGLEAGEAISLYEVSGLLGGVSAPGGRD
ncbi:efflux RND transporter periplasmic adaptor subunit [Microbulbifer agarilyticus]|uniref:efflux RND transporter periplasmic adaptor subunit n=1 Tax=Microbulbifer agarilyticus TaxID=260552 RepID=UPI001C9867D4|nr:efflux RND transporter periplasmic adaptor subunit [Microbulbifer agarilyticus]MBY6189660.1 efflux RND transporter periplasmic adaptor subunit [Microbulbifer agarilyticus]